MSKRFTTRAIRGVCGHGRGVAAWRAPNAFLRGHHGSPEGPSCDGVRRWRRPCWDLRWTLRSRAEGELMDCPRLQQRL